MQRNAKERRKIDEKLVEIEELMARNIKETDRQLKNLGKQLGGLGRKFGGFAEGMALPSMRKILSERFGMDQIAPCYRATKNGQSMELDVLGFSPEKGEAYVVEVKSKLRDGDIDTMIARLRQAPKFYDELRGKKIYGILAVVDSGKEAEKRVFKTGLYLAKIRDETFELNVPEGFTPRSFGG